MSKGNVGVDRYLGHSLDIDAHIAADPFGHFAALFVGTNLVFHHLTWDRALLTAVGGYADMNRAFNGMYQATGDTANQQHRASNLIQGAGRGGAERFNFGKPYILAFTYNRSMGDNANGVAFLQLKTATTHGILAALGVGIRVDNLTLYGEAHDGTTYTSTNLNTTLSLNQEYDILIYSDGDAFIKWYIDGVLKATQTANIPKTVLSNANGVATIDNGASAIDTKHQITDMLLICKKA